MNLTDYYPEIGDLVFHDGAEHVVVGFYGNGRVKIADSDGEVTKALRVDIEYVGPYLAGGFRGGETPDHYSYNWRHVTRAAAEAVCREDFGCSIDELQDREADWSTKLATAITGWSYTYRGPGRFFTAEPYLALGRNRVLIRQACGSDI